MRFLGGVLGCFAKTMNKLANLKLGLADGPGLDATEPVLARYDKGLQD